MKHLQQNWKRRAGIVAMVGLLALGLTSCLKDNNNSYVQQPAGLVTVIDASTDAPALDFYLDNNMVNLTPLHYATGLDYFGAYTGKRTAYFYASNSRQIIASDTLTVKENKAYSIYLSNKVATPNILVLTDSISRPASGMAAFRFVDLSPDAPAVDVAINGTVVVPNKTYKGFTAFIPIQPSNNYTIDIRLAGTRTVVTTRTAATMVSGSVYTILLRGSSTATDDTKLGIGFVTTAVY